MLTIKHQLAEDFGTHITSVPDHITITRRREAGFHVALRGSPKADTAKAVISYIHAGEGVRSIVVDEGDRAWIMNANGKTVASV